MKPKERFYNYALFSTGCDRSSSTCKDDSPIDLSTKRHPPKVHSIPAFTSSDIIDAHSISSLNKFNERPSKYLIPNEPRNLQPSPSLLPYLLLNKSCYNVPSVDASPSSDFKISKNGVVFDRFGNTYAINGRTIVPMRSAERLHKNGSPFQRSPLNNTSPSTSSTSSPTHQSLNEYNETRRLLERSPTNSSFSSTSDYIKVNRSQNGYQTSKRIFIKKAKSFPLLPTVVSNKKFSRFRISKSKSESDIPSLLRNKSTNQMLPICLSSVKNCRRHSSSDLTRKFSKSDMESPIAYDHHYPNGIENDFSDREKEDDDDVMDSGDDYDASDDALDLRVTNSTPSFVNNYVGHPDEAERLFHHINTFLVNSPHKEDDLSMAPTSPLDLYRQYYYYLMHQPALASRAAVAMAETYAKLISTAAHHQSRLDFHDSNSTSKYEHENTSPDYIINGTRPELRSADTTNNGSFDRKRISRPLTGKHVRHGTGASPSTLMTLRNMIQERQRLKEIGVDINKFTKTKTGKRTKRK